MGAKERMLRLLRERLGQYISVRELGEVAQSVDFTRALRTLRQEGWDLEWKREGVTTYYRLNSLQKLKSGIQREPVDEKTRYRILQRDNSTCQRCGRNPTDGAKLTIDHKIPVDWGGTNDDGNLWTLCRECNEGKQAFFRDFDADAMKEIMVLPSAADRLLAFISRNYGKPLSVAVLGAVARTRDWTRQIRRFRELGYFEYRVNRLAWTYTFKPKTSEQSNHPWPLSRD